MFNLIRMDMHRLIHSTSAWIVLLFVIVVAVFGVAMTNMDIQATLENPSAAIEETSSGQQIGISVTADPKWASGEIEIGDIFSIELSASLLALLCVIFSALFTNAEQKNGYIKNIAGQFPHRGELIASKLFAVAVQVLVMLLLFFITVVVSGYAFWGDKFYLGSMFSVLKVFGTQYLLHLGLSALIMFFCIFTRSTAFGITAGILISSNMAAPIYMSINKFIADFNPHWDFDISEYVLDGNITRIAVDSTADVISRAVIVGIAFTAVFTALAMLTIKKRDIR